MEKRDFFISYTRSDKAWAIKIADALIADGYSVNMQARDINLGQSFLRRMNEFLKSSENFLAVWSKAYSESGYCMDEFEAAYHAWRKKTMRNFLTVRVEDYPMEPLYAMRVHADLFGMEWSEAERRLLNAVHDKIPRPLLVPDPDVSYERGNDYFFGMNGVQQDYAEARRHYEEAAKQGYAKALFRLGVLYERGWGVAQDYNRARNCYEQAAEKGHASALYNLGNFYLSGESIAQDYDKARDYYEQAASKGLADALQVLGVLYEHGYGVAQDYNKAQDYYQQAAAKGHVDALQALGVLYERGYGVAQDYDKARDYYEQAAAKNHVDAMYNLGVFYRFGKGVPQDYNKARDYYEQAAARGHASAMYNLGKLYEYGYVSERDFAKALEYYRKSTNKFVNSTQRLSNTRNRNYNIQF